MIIRKVNYLITKDSFIDFCKEAKYHIVVFKKKNWVKIAGMMVQIMIDIGKDLWTTEEDVIAILESISIAGKPDFFLYNKKKYLFVEHKTYNDHFHYDQILWAYNNPEMPFLLIHSLYKKETFKDIVQNIT